MFENHDMGSTHCCSRRFTLSFLLLLVLLPFGGTPIWGLPEPPQNVSSLEQATQAKADYVVIRPVANMYSKAGVQSDVVSQAIYGVDVIRVKGKWHWVKVRTADQYTGWMQSSELRRLRGRPYASKGSTVRVAQLSANIYREPDVTKHAPLLTVPWESRLEVESDKVDERGRWLKVRLADDGEGFVQWGDVSSDFTPLTIAQTIVVAKRFLGVTYTWGGSSDFGFDCSGYTQMLMRQRGIVMPRDADLQAAWSGVIPVERQELQAGDLLFFGDRPDHITHTGMYIGEGQFIHDTTHEHPGVQISILDDEPWTKLLVAARRPKT
jgi:gamma-D-glutamyl-L-lysine dipeptidyl-peptidase